MRPAVSFETIAPIITSTIGAIGAIAAAILGHVNRRQLQGQGQKVDEVHKVVVGGGERP